MRFARTIAVMWEKRAQQYFRSEEDFHRGMKLLQEYLAACSRFSSYEDLSTNFLDLLDDTTDRETDLLDRASKFHNSKRLDDGQDPYASHLDQLSKLIDDKLKAVQTISSANNAASICNVKISQAFEDFLDIHRARWKKIGGMEKTYRQSFFPLLLEITGDIYTNQLTKSHVNDLIKVLQVYPANKNKKSQYQALQSLDFLNINTPDEDRLSPTSKRKYKTHIGAFLKWLRSSDLTSIDLDVPLQAIKIQKIRAADQKAVFTCEDLKKLFNSNDYSQGLHETASRFWVPLIAIFTGARLNEICQLSVNDIYIEETSKIWVFDFNQNNDVPKKSLKRPDHERLVPIHKKLVELGFIEYFECIKKKNIQIFSELKYTRDENKYGNDIQRWFNRTYTNPNNCNITTPKTSFHSLRHTVATHFSTIHHLTENQVATGLGQTPQGGVFETRYAKQHAFAAYKDYFNLINFDKCFDTKQIRNWKNQKFFTSLK
jgi:integrase